MITSLHLSNYRGFQQFDLNALAQVNLIVGRNNSGKTSVLEAIQILGNPKPLKLLRTLESIALKRREITRIDDDEIDERPRTATTIRHFFHSHQILPRAELTISDQGLSQVNLSVWDIGSGDFDSEVSSDPSVRSSGSQGIPSYQGVESFPSSQAIFASTSLHASTLLSFVSEEGAILQGPRRFPVLPLGATEGNVAAGQETSRPPVFISVESFSTLQMQAPWNQVVMAGREAEVVKSMGILDSEIKSIVMLTQGMVSPRNPVDFYVGRNGNSPRVPLGTQGEGMRRLLSLALGLIQAEGSILLIDEIDTGLHYSVLVDLWRLVIQSAIQSNVQVFATTHSYDCLQGLAQYCLDNPVHAGHVALTKIDRHQSESITFAGHELPDVVNASVEVR